MLNDLFVVKKVNYFFFFGNFFDILDYDKRVFIVLGKIQEIINNSVIIKLSIDINNQPNLVGLHVVFEDEKKNIGYGWSRIYRQSPVRTSAR